MSLRSRFWADRLAGTISSTLIFALRPWQTSCLNLVLEYHRRSWEWMTGPRDWLSKGMIWQRREVGWLICCTCGVSGVKSENTDADRNRAGWAKAEVARSLTVI